MQLPWWAPPDIRFTREQVLFILGNRELLREGIWPRDPNNDSGYVDESQRAGVSEHAPFENPAIMIAEVEARLVSCGDAGEALQDEARYFDDWHYLSRPARRALNYCAGWRRRCETYARWCWKQEQKRKGEACQHG